MVNNEDILQFSSLFVI